MVWAGGRLRVFGDADVLAQHGVDRERHADCGLHFEQYEYKPEHWSRDEQLRPPTLSNRRVVDLHVQSDNDGNADNSASNHPNLTLNGYVGGVMVTATGGTPGAPANITKPYVVTNVTGQPGDVGIFLPGNSSEMLAIFNVRSVAARPPAQ